MFWEEIGLQIFWGMVTHSILMTSLVSCSGLILDLLAWAQDFRAALYLLARKWFAMYYGSGTDVSFIVTSRSPTAEIFGYSHRYPQCTYSSIVILFQFTESKEHTVCDLFSVRQEEHKSRKQPSMIRPLVHIVQSSVWNKAERASSPSDFWQRCSYWACFACKCHLSEMHLETISEI